MTHLVVFKSPEGKQAYHQTTALDDAVRFIEHLKNSEGVDKAKLFKLTEVPLEFKAVYKVEVAASGPVAEEPPGVAAPDADADPGSEPELIEAGMGRRRFSR